MFSQPLIKRCLAWLMLCAFAAAITFSANAAELLDVDQAFQWSAKTLENGDVVVRAKIAPGYYLYRDKLKVETPDGKKVSLAWPAGVAHKDPLFGSVQIYRNEVEARVPVAGASKLDVSFQGCADIGVCYPPEVRQVSVMPAQLVGQTSAGWSLGALVDGFSNAASNLGLLDAQPELLDADLAFQFVAETKGNRTVLFNWQMADGYYLYKDKVEVRLLAPESVTLLALKLPKGQLKEDAIFGMTEVYYGLIQGEQRLLRSSEKAEKLQLEVTYQGCAEIGVCYPPIIKSVVLDLPAVTGEQAVVASESSEDQGPVRGKQSEQDRLAQTIGQGSVALVMLSFLGFGLLLAFTPCVFPMIPILSGIIVGQGRQITTRKAFVLSSAYVLASALTYTLFGVLAGKFGSNLQAAFQNPWIIGSFSALFVLLALSMFGHFQFQLPSALRDKLADLNHKQRAGTITGAAGMGVLSTLIVGPCVAPPLAGALIYIGQTGDAVLGGMALFALGLGMGLPLIVIGTSAGKLLPKAGQWMESIKAVFGVLLLAVAIWLLQRIIPAPVAMLLWAALLITCAVYLRALDGLPTNAGNGQRLLKGAGLLMLIYGVVLIVGVGIGGGNPLQPLRGLSTGGAIESSHALPFQRIEGEAELDAALQQAAQNNQMVMLDFYADWCVSCVEMELFTFSDTRIQNQLADTVLLQVDVTDNNEQHKALLQRFNLVGPPVILFFGSNQQEQKPYRVVGFMAADPFHEHIQQVSACVQTNIC